MMRKRPGFKADLFIFALIIFMGGIAFSMFVLEKDPDARLSLFGISVWLLIIVGAIYWRTKKTHRLPKAHQSEKQKDA